MSRANPRYRRPNIVLFAPTGNVWRVRIRGLIEGQVTYSTFYYQDNNSPGTGNPTMQGNLYNALNAVGALIPAYLAACSADWTLEEVYIDSPNTFALSPYGVLGTNSGGGPAGHEPTTVAAIINKTTSIRSQCGRGHVSVPAVPTAWVTASHVTTATAYSALAAAMVVQVTGGTNTFTPCMYSKGTRVLKQQGAQPLLTCTLNTLLGTVRRRKIGRGK